MSEPRLSYEDYTVSIICAFHEEMAAIGATLDEGHGAAQGTTGGKDAGFSFGRIGEHNVVIVCPAASIASIASVARNMMLRFPIKIGLMVGIGDGVWSEQNDIRLGDVVVSGSNRYHGGVVQWEHVRNSVFQKTGALNKPPRPVLDAIQSLKLEETLESREVDAVLEGMDSMFRGNPDHEPDELFEASYERVSGDTCAKCDRSRLVRNRPRRTDHGRPRVHYGTIASSNAVVRDGPTRDCIARNEGIICFETDAAGLMATFPCVMIRGICDYADSHRNRRWHLRAAAVAAAYAKVLLQSIPAADLASKRLASEVSGK
jgi:nucleoside phosphorylase